MDTPSEGRTYFLDLSLFSVLRDGGQGNKSLVLESYFNDLYKLFVRKLTEFECQSKLTHEEGRRLRSLLEELIKIKGMIAGREEGMQEREEKA